MELSFSDLKCKEVINVTDGKKLGCVIDVVFHSCNGMVLGFIVPGNKKGFNFFKPCENIFIPYNNICKIGIDVILVELFVAPCPNPKSPNKNRFNCSNLINILDSENGEEIKNKSLDIVDPKIYPD